MLDETGIVLACRTDGAGRQGIAATVLAGIGGAVGGRENHRAGQAVISEAIGKAEKGGRGGHILMVLRSILICLAPLEIFENFLGELNYGVRHIPQNSSS
jgi:MYXO-CTERM domain-containing protein